MPTLLCLASGKRSRRLALTKSVQRRNEAYRENALRLLLSAAIEMVRFIHDEVPASKINEESAVQVLIIVGSTTT